MTRPAPTRPPRVARPLAAWLIITLCLGALAACGGGGGSSDSSGDPSSGGGGSGGGTTPVNADARLLASNCFQCHGTNGGGGFENIRGDEAGEVREYRNLGQKPANRDIMAAHAQGYTDEQITLIVRYLQQ